MEYEEHEKRAWSVDFSRTEPTMLVSGSDDCKVLCFWWGCVLIFLNALHNIQQVKIWCTKQETSVVNKV
ncbi:putative transcription factor WD40-like family [Helianthus annuus]|nr:putative transcription factor WD40-like family [Helianthus annuus]